MGNHSDPNDSDPNMQTYQEVVRVAVICARMLSIYDIPALLASIDHAESVGGFAPKASLSLDIGCSRRSCTRSP